MLFSSLSTAFTFPSSWTFTTGQNVTEEDPQNRETEGLSPAISLHPSSHRAAEVGLSSSPINTLPCISSQSPGPLTSSLLQGNPKPLFSSQVTYRASYE